MTALAIPNAAEADDPNLALRLLLLAPAGPDSTRIAAAFPPGFVVTPVTKVRDACALIVAESFDAALVYAIPPHDGALRTLAVAANAIALIALTDPGDSGAGLAAMRAGAQEFLAADSPPAALRRAVRYAMERAELLSEFKALHGALLAAERRAAENERLRAFVDRVSHEFRTPAAIISLACDRIEREGGVETAIGRIRDALDRQTELIESLLEASRDALAAPSLGRTAVEVLAVAQAARLRQGDAASRIHVYGDAAARVLADRAGLGAALDRLLANALRHGGACAPVEVAVAAAGAVVVISVRDFGPGVPAGERDKGWVPARPGPGAADLFTALALLLVLGISYAAGAAGVSMAMGAFLAGLMLADTEFKHQIEADLRPFRGLLLGLFFMTVGMQMDLRLVMDRPLDLALLVVLGLTLKVVVTAGLARLFGFSAGQSGQIGLLTAQGGEFAFVLFAAGAAALPAEARSLLPAAIVIGMVMTPALAALGAKFARRMDLEDHGEPSSPAAEGSPRNHVVICGFGRVGQTLGRMASGVNAPWLALDMAPHRIAEARKRELPVFFGDAAREDVLRAIHIDHAAVAAVTIDDPQAALQTVSALKRVAPQIKIVARAQDPNHAQALYAAGAARATPELLEGSLQLAASMMRGLGREDEEIDREVELFREEARTRLEDLIPADPRKRGKTA